VEESLPSVVLAASYLGRDTSEVTVDLNGSRVAKRLDGRALSLNPGEHRLRFVHASGRVIERTLVIHEGEKNRIVRADFDPPEPDRPDSTMTVPMTRERPAAPGPPIAERSPLALYVAGSVAVVSAGIATFFGLSALSRARSARDPESGCEPFCPDDRVRDIRTRAIVADIGYLVSVLAAADTLYLYLAPPAPADGDWARAPARDAHR
jgi:hypothetical protein